MTIKSIFEPISPDNFPEFITLLEGTQPDFDEMTDWDDLSDRDQAGIILQFSIVAGMRVSEVMELVWYKINQK